jgi:hypothetical protein
MRQRDSPMNIPGMESLLSARSEQEAVEMAPIVVKFGTAEYKIPVLRMMQAREWRKQFMEIAVDVFGVTSPGATNDTFKAGLAFMFLEFPEKVADLVFAYAGDELPKDAVLKHGTEEQLARAFSKIMVVAFPFSRELAMTSQILEKAKQFQLSARSTK